MPFQTGIKDTIFGDRRMVFHWTLPLAYKGLGPVAIDPSRITRTEPRQVGPGRCDILSHGLLARLCWSWLQPSPVVPSLA